ncbi:hypothetical protein OG585_26835 [Streptomyces sp. NBC_01340]|uniref:hypothetical protein n=1 Tax=unclassified Streptomyces TaxID=2593676 RepID=UPI00224EDC94|nr:MULTISPECIES: hypothetical protein [unclassified Streptomyces]MCX4456205.1 hypothetical protein [Streptomyces sp. NBC_01719]MCX4495564.1 hypothetical protein [Streptomyces sp. NBC_01728]WSI40518.1 hypothetical protein OG585_26835 [Streptomyces sp. NBC_01340]
MHPLIRGDSGPTAVHTQKIENDGTSYGSEWTLYDGLLRPRQQQTEGDGGGRKPRHGIDLQGCGRGEVPDHVHLRW